MGRETRYRPTPAPLGEAIAWMTSVGGEWDERLAALERLGRAGASGGSPRRRAPRRQALLERLELRAQLVGQAVAELREVLA